MPPTIAKLPVLVAVSVFARLLAIMKRKTEPVIFAIGLIAFVGVAVIVLVKAGLAISADIANLTWDESNVAVLRSADVTDVEKLVSRVICGEKSPCGVHLDQFAWADVEGNGRYELVGAWNLGGKVQTVSIYQRNSSGKTNGQSIELEGYAQEDSLTNAIRDLNGDGKKELIIDSGFGEGRDMAETPLAEFPLVYRLRDGQYVEASREFPSFYDKEVLPPLEQKIAALQKKLDSEVEAKESEEALMKEYHWYKPDIDSHTSPEQAEAVKDSEQLALLQRLRNHILLVLGRRLTAEEEKEPREWMRSSNGRLVWYSELAFEEMGGHETEVHEAEQAISRMDNDSRKASAGTRTISPAPAMPPFAPGN